VRGASLEPKRVAIVIKVREVLEVYHAHPPVGRFPFCRLVGVHGSDAFHDHDERHAKRIPRLNAPNPFSAHCPNRDVGVFPVRLRGCAHHGPQRDLIGA
jgi:hypothetical protein